VVLAATLLTALLLVPAVAHAGRGGNGKHYSVSTSSVVSVSASLSPVQGGSPVYLTGWGTGWGRSRSTSYIPGTDMWAAGMWSTGCFDAVVPTSEPGLYTIEVYRGGSTPLTLKASTELTVQ
jgi:hypothetical protein